MAKQLPLEECKVVLESKTVSLRDMDIKRGGTAEATEVMAELWQFAENRERRCRVGFESKPLSVDVTT